jgi:hypothetical protein
LVPDVATVPIPGEIDTEVAFAVLQLSVELLPFAIVWGEVENETVGCAFAKAHPAKTIKQTFVTKEKTLEGEKQQNPIEEHAPVKIQRC